MPVAPHMAPPMPRTGVYRSNLHFEVLTTRHEPERREHLVRLVRELDGTGIIYASSVKQVDLLHRLLNEVGFMAARDHRRLPMRQRQAELARFNDNDVQAIVATTGLAAHVTKPDVRFVIHYAFPDSIQSYYDEAGRAGLDDQRARCVLLHDPEGARADDVFVAGRTPALAVVSTVYSTLERLGAHRHIVPRVELAAALDAISREDLRDAIAMLKALTVISERRGLKLRLLKPELDLPSFARLMDRHAAEHGAARRARDGMLAYAETSRCRWKVLLEHLGEPVSWERCGTCDNCRRRPDGDTAAPPLKATHPPNAAAPNP